VTTRARSSESGAAQRPVDVAELPRPLRLVLEGADLLLTDHISSSGGQAAALALAESRQRAALDQLVALLAQHGPMDVAELVHMSDLVGDPESYRETEHMGVLGVDVGPVALPETGAAFDAQRRERSLAWTTLAASSDVPRPA
jgi:hypothetical protein